MTDYTKNRFKKLAGLLTEEKASLKEDQKIKEILKLRIEVYTDPETGELLVSWSDLFEGGDGAGDSLDQFCDMLKEWANERRNWWKYQ